MFDNKLFEDWLDKEATNAMQKITSGKAATSNEMMVLVLKAQTNHITHMEQDLRGEMTTLGNDLRGEMTTLGNDLRGEMIALGNDLRGEMISLRQDMDKRFEQVDKRFEQVDRRFDAVINRIDNFMKWSFSTTLIVGGFVVAAIRYL